MPPPPHPTPCCPHLKRQPYEAAALFASNPLPSLPPGPPILSPSLQPTLHFGSSFNQIWNTAWAYATAEESSTLYKTSGEGRLPVSRARTQSPATGWVSFQATPWWTTASLWRRCRHQDRWGTLWATDKPGSTGERGGGPSQCSYHDSPTTSMKQQKDMPPEDGCPGSEGVQYATGEKWRAITDSSRKDEEAGPAETALSCGSVWWWKESSMP